MSSVIDESAPIGTRAGSAWRVAIAAALGQCQCVESRKGHTHKIYDAGRCPVRQGVFGGRLYLLPDGRIMCAECFDLARKLTSEPAPAPEGEQDSLF